MIFICLTIINIYELKRFGFLYECISDFQLNNLTNKGLFIGFARNVLIIVGNFLVLRAFKTPEIENDDKARRLIVMEDSKEHVPNQEQDNYVEYVI
jgi:hypothetical protein